MKFWSGGYSATLSSDFNHGNGGKTESSHDISAIVCVVGQTDKIGCAEYIDRPF